MTSIQGTNPQVLMQTFEPNFTGPDAPELKEAFDKLKDEISKDNDEINQAIQAAGTPAEDQDPDAGPIGADPSQG